MSDERMFTQLMESQPAPDDSPKQAAKPEPSAKPARQPKDELALPDDLEDIGDAGYTSHSYRLTDTEVRWLRRFCLKLSERMDRTVSQNELIRTLFRIADKEWREKPSTNRVADELSRNKF
jgi:hypothetical protein